VFLAILLVISVVWDIYHPEKKDEGMDAAEKATKPPLPPDQDPTIPRNEESEPPKD